MKLRRISYFLSCMLLIVLLSACNKPVDLKLQLQPGDKRVVEVRSDLTESKSTMRYTYEVEEVDASGVATVKVTTDLSSMIDQIPGGMGGGMNAAGNPFGEIGEVVLTMKLASDGTVQSVDGMDAVVDKMIATAKKGMEEQMANLPPQATAIMGNMGNMKGMFDSIFSGLKKALGDEAMKRQMQPMTGFYPDQPVRAGSTWTKTVPISGLMPADVDMTYTVTARGGGVMNLKFDGTIKPAPGSGMDMGVLKMDFNPSGTQSGTMQVDEATGWVTAWSIDQTMTGSTEMKMGAGLPANIPIPQGTSIPIDDKGTIYIESYAE